MPRSLPAYSSGTVTVAYTNGAWNVAGSGTNFISPDGVPNYTLVAGDMFVIPGAGFSPISAVNSASSLTLSNWTGGPVAAGSSYTIYRFEGLPSSAATALVTELLTLFTDANPPAYATVDTGAVRSKWDDDGAGNARMRVRASGLTDASYVLAARVNDATGVWQVPAIVGARAAVSDANYSVAAGVSTVAYTAITAARTVTLPAASSFFAGQQLLVVDESGSCSATKTITLAPNGSDTINGAASAVVSNAYGYLVIESNAAGKWTIVDSFVVTAAFTGDSGSGGAIGLVPAPPAGSAASNEVLGAGGSWVGHMAGFRNRVINGNFDVWQRGTTFAPLPFQYCADRFFFDNSGTGASATISKATAPTGFRGRYALNIAASSLAVGGILDVGQRFESQAVYDMDSQACVLSFDISGTTSAGALTGIAFLSGNTAVDNGTFSVPLGSVPFTVPAGASEVTVAFSAAQTAGLKNGAEVIIRTHPNRRRWQRERQHWRRSVRVRNRRDAVRTAADGRRAGALPKVFLDQYRIYQRAGLFDGIGTDAVRAANALARANARDADDQHHL